MSKESDRAMTAAMGCFLFGCLLNLCGSALIDAFYHPPTGYSWFGWSDWGTTAWSLRITGFFFAVGGLAAAGDAGRE